MMNSMIQRKTYTNNLLPTTIKLGNKRRFSNSSDLKKYFTQNNMETNEADTTNGKSSLKKIKNKLLFSIFLMMALLVNAQNIEIRAYNDQNFTVKADTFTGSGYTTVNGGPTTSQVTQASISTMPSSVSGYAGVHVVVYSQWIGTLPTSAQFDALVEFIRQGGVVIANVEREEPTFREILDRLMGSGHGITKTAAGTTNISPVNFVHPGEGTLKLRSVTNTSTPTTTSYSTFAGVPSAARILHGTSNTGCNGTCLDFVVPTFPGVATTLNGQTVRGMLIMSGEVQGPFTGPTGFSTRALAMDQSYAKLIYDFYNNPTAMASRRAWSATSTNQNPICIPETFVEPCNAGNTAPIIGSNKIANSCPTSTGNLTTLVTSTAPSGTTITYHTGFPATDANKIADPTTVSTGTYYAAYWDATNNCYSPVSEPIYVSMCLTNTCPTTTVDLTTHTTGTPPSGTTLQWHTSNIPSSGTLVSNPTAVGTGSYYATYYDATNNCYSPVSTPISVTINACIPDTDGDGLTDDIDIDDDNDGILDSVEGYCSSTPILLTKATYTATGSGTGGRPVVNFTAPVTGSGRRLLLLYLNIERDHTPSAYGDNWESTIYSNGFTGMPTVSFGGVNMIKRNYAYQFHGVTTDGATAKLSNSQFLYSLSDANITSGNNSFDLSNFNLPLNAGDEWKATVIVYDQVNYSEYVSASGFNSSNNFPSTLSTSGAMLSPTQPAGLSESNNTLIALGQISNSNGMQLTSSWNTINSGTITNSNGTYASDPGATSGSSENDGISNYIASITGVTGTQTINFNITNNALLGGLMLYRIIGYACTIRDTDGDGTPDYLDLDSDGDGCPDAIEGDENVTASQLTANRISGAVDANGVPVLVNSGGTADIGADQAQGIGQSQDTSKNNCIDSDGDGVPDWQDLDDDNDGILDTVEYGQCSSAIPASGAYVKQNLYLEDFGTLPNLGSSSSNTYGILQTIPSWSANVTGMTYDTTDALTDGNWTLTVNPNYIDDFSTAIWNGTSLYDSQWLDTLDYTSGDVNGLFFAANPNDAPVGGSQLYRTPNIIVLPNVPLKASLWLLNMKKVGASGTDPIIKIDIVNASDNSIISTSTQSIAETGLWTEVSTTFSTGTTATSVYIRITNMVTSASGSGNDFGIDGISLDLTFCDLDSDGIPNYLDLDSDNDGCLDALEGGANITSSQLVNAGGTVTVGTGSTAANQNLCATSTCVDANGVPTIVSGGQSIGDSQNAAIKSGCFCYKPAQTTGTTLDTNHGITALGRAGADNGNWPMVRKGAWTALEAKTKGFVINRIPTTAQVIAIPNPVEGMMVYDEEADCLKIYTTTDNGATYSWQCFNTQTCPE